MKTHQKSKNKSLRSEAVLVLQGGGSLGAYECGVYKKLFERGIEFDILAGSSIEAINASIICSAQNAKKDAAAVLENFWLSISEDIYSKLLPLPLSTLLPVEKQVNRRKDLWSIGMSKSTFYSMSYMLLHYCSEHVENHFHIVRSEKNNYHYYNKANRLS
jgi:predicted acylesterase/phospholipase RssA